MVQPHPVAYSRNGFVGPYTIAVKPDYIIGYRSVKGPYAPHRFDPFAIDGEVFADPRAFPVPILRDTNDDRLSVEFSVRAQAMPFAVRNVFADEVHLIADGSAIVALVFVATGMAKVLGHPKMVEASAHLGYSMRAFRIIGLLEVLGAVGILLAPLCLPLGVAAATGLILMMIGGSFAHLRASDPVTLAAPALVCGLLAAATLGVQIAAA